MAQLILCIPEWCLDGGMPLWWRDTHPTNKTSAWAGEFVLNKEMWPKTRCVTLCRRILSQWTPSFCSLWELWCLKQCVLSGRALRDNDRQHTASSHPMRLCGLCWEGNASFIVRPWHIGLFVIVVQHIMLNTWLKAESCASYLLKHDVNIVALE